MSHDINILGVVGHVPSKFMDQGEARLIELFVLQVMSNINQALQQIVHNDAVAIVHDCFVPSLALCGPATD